MSKLNSLQLLNYYGNSDSSDDEVPGCRVSTKRMQKFDEESSDSKRFERLPLPNQFAKTTQVVPLEYEDNPDLHDGRIRSFPHERGNWSTYVYIPYEPNSAVEAFVDKIIEDFKTRNIILKEIDHYHISLTRTVILRHHWITMFIDSVRERTAHFKKFLLLFDNLKIYCNEERTRTFIGLQIQTGFDTLKSIVANLDSCLGEFRLPPFYKDPSFHMSLAWCVGDLEEELNNLLPDLNETLQEFINNYSQENWYIYVEQLICKSGNKSFTFHLT